MKSFHRMKIQEELANYLTGGQSLDDFCDWFIPETWDIHQWAPPQTQEMVYAIKLLLDEKSSGVWSERELQEKLRPFVTSVTIGPVVPAQQAKRLVKATAKKAKFVRSPKSPRPEIRKSAFSATHKKRVKLFSSVWTVFPGTLVVPSAQSVTLKAFASSGLR